MEHWWAVRWDAMRAESLAGSLVGLTGNCWAVRWVDWKAGATAGHWGLHLAVMWERNSVVATADSKAGRSVSQWAEKTGEHLAELWAALTGEQMVQRRAAYSDDL